MESGGRANGATHPLMWSVCLSTCPSLTAVPLEVVVFLLTSTRDGREGLAPLPPTAWDDEIRVCPVEARRRPLAEKIKSCYRGIPLRNASSGTVTRHPVFLYI